MKKVDTNFFNPKQKEINWFNRNFYYLTTFLFIGLMCLGYFVLKDTLAQLVAKNQYWNFILVVFRHSSVGHLVGNIISFFIISLFLERHFGSIKYFCLIIFAIPLSYVLTFLITHYNWVGESGLNYFLYAIFVTVIIFNFKDYVLSKWQNIFTFFIIALVCVLMCFEGDVMAITNNINEFFKFGVFTDFITNSAHYLGAIMGGVVGMFAGIYSLSTTRKED